MKKSNQLTGITGEYLVAAELSKLGYIATVTLRHTDGVDVLASTLDGSKTVAIQVKTSSDSKKKWLLNKKAEDRSNSNLFYVFVLLHSGKRPPSFHVVPSKTVANFIKKDHKAWMSKPGKNGQKHKDTDMRQFPDFESRYENKWETLGL